MDTAFIFTTSFILAFSGAMMPGPLLAVVISESARRGFWSGPLAILGHAVLELILVVLLAAGLASFLGKVQVQNFIAIVGGLFLVYMGWGMLKDGLAGKIEIGSGMVAAGNSGRSGKNRSAFYPVGAGFLVSLSNPYWVLWWATAGLLYITQALRGGLEGIAAFFTGHILADLVWYSVVAAVIAGGRRFISKKLMGGFLAACGLFLCGLGLYFIKGSIFNYL